MGPPRLRWHDARATFHDFAIVTFAVDPGALGAHLPQGLAPDLFTLAGAPAAFVSAVSFRARHFRLRGLPWPRASFAQTNYRVYVRAAAERAVWFFGSSLGTRGAVLARRLFGLPCHRDRIRLEAEWDGEVCRRYALRTEGWGAADLDVAGTDAPPGRLAGFESEAEAHGVLTHPLVGYVARGPGAPTRLAVWHPPLTPRLGEARRARFAVFERLGLVAPGQLPHSVLLQRATEFVTFLPPRRG